MLWITLWMMCHWMPASLALVRFPVSGHILIDIMKYMKRMKKVFCLMDDRGLGAMASDGETPGRSPCE